MNSRSSDLSNGYATVAKADERAAVASLWRALAVRTHSFIDLAAT
jgi:hypothetical protein